MPDRERADAGPEQVEGAHRDGEAAVDLAEHVARGRPGRRRRPGVPMRVRGDHVERLAGQPGGVAGARRRR